MKPIITSNWAETLRCRAAGMSVVEIAKQRRIARSAVHEHLTLAATVCGHGRLVPSTISPELAGQMLAEAEIDTARARSSHGRDGVMPQHRPITGDTVEIVHWFAQRGLSAVAIARELNRRLQDVERALAMPAPRIAGPTAEEVAWRRHGTGLAHRAIGSGHGRAVRMPVTAVQLNLL